jgi:N-acetylglucosamine-6-phosphate deacetylase
LTEIGIGIDGDALAVKHDHGIIRAVESADAGGAVGRYISPGFFDVQVNGYTGFDYSSDALAAGDVMSMVRVLAQGGTTRHVATIISSPQGRIVRNVGIIRQAREESELVAWAVPFVHIEGPYISPIDGPRGAHDAGYVRHARFDEYRQWQETSGGIVKIVTIAPESEGALDFIERVSAEGVIVALGHTNADPAQIREAISAGAAMSTHLGNGSSATIPRLKNYIWEQLAADELHASIICDGYHLPPAVMKTFYRAKGKDRLVMVSDVGPLGGCEVGKHKWGNIDVEVHQDGHLSVADTPYLAGAGHLLDRGVAQFCKATDTPIEQAMELVCRNPRSLLGMEDDRMTLQPGQPADFVVFEYSRGADSVWVRKTVTPFEVLCDE